MRLVSGNTAAAIACMLFLAGCMTTPDRDQTEAANRRLLAGAQEIVILGAGDVALSSRAKPHVLTARRRRDGAAVVLPLKNTVVTGDIAFDVAKVTVRQTYRNTSVEPIDALYDLPLPVGALVRDFIVTIGDRRIRGIVRGREEAQALFRAAQLQGLPATLLLEESPASRPLKVSRIGPGSDVDLEFTFLEEPTANQSEFTFVVPALEADTSRDKNTGATSLGVRLEIGWELVKVESPSHRIATERLSTGGVWVRLEGESQTLEREFVLRWSVPTADRAAMESSSWRLAADRAVLGARVEIANLATQGRRTDALRLALEHGILTDTTAFLLIDTLHAEDQRAEESQSRSQRRADS